MLVYSYPLCFLEVTYSISAERPIRAVSEFVAQLSILELLDNVRLSNFYFFFSHLLWLSFSIFFPNKMCFCCRPFLLLVTRLSCTFMLLLRNARLWSWYSKLTQRPENLWRRRFSLWRMVLLLCAVFRFVYNQVHYCITCCKFNVGLRCRFHFCLFMKKTCIWRS